MDLVKPNLSCVTSLAALVGFEDINGVMESSVGGLAVNRRGPWETVKNQDINIEFWTFYLFSVVGSNSSLGSVLTNTFVKQSKSYMSVVLNMEAYKEKDFLILIM